MRIKIRNLSVREQPEYLRLIIVSMQQQGEEIVCCHNSLIVTVRILQSSSHHDGVSVHLATLLVKPTPRFGMCSRLSFFCTSEA